MAITDAFEKGEPTVDDVQHSYDKAVKAALYIVEKRARAVLTEYPALHEFYMAMGVYGFRGANDSDNEWFIVHDRWTNTSCKALDDFISEWDEYLKLTGTPMRFTATGPVVRQW